MSARKIIFIFLLSVLPFVQTRGQGRFPVFKADPAVSEGFLDNGMKYFVIENRSLRGTAEFALVQRTCQNGKDTLFLPSWDGSYAALFGRLGVAPSRRGYVESGDGYRMLRLRDVPVLEGGKVVDSLLFSLFSMARGTDASLQTVIVAGDISGKDILSRLRMFSMTVAATDGVTSPTGRHPDVMRGPVVNVMPDSSGLAVLRVSCRMPRFSRQRSGTVLYTVSLRMENIMEAIVSKSLRQILERDSIPVAGISFESGRRRADSVEDKYTIEISTRPEYIYEVAARTGELLRQLEREGVNYGAYSWAMSLVRGREWRHSASAPDNGTYVDKCLSAVLKGTDMASDAEKVRYFRGRDVPDSVSIVHFNRFLDAIIGNDPNLEIECRGAVDGISADSLLSRYRSAWPDGPQMPLFKVSGHDTLAFPSASKKKVKFSEPRADQVSGGLRWTYLRKKDKLLSVVYRKAATDGLMHYSLIFPGGAESLRGLGNGALAYIGDVFRLCDVGALDGEHFFTLLESAGITMECRVTLTDMCIEGCAPSSSFPLLLKSLVEVSTARKPSPAAFERYMLAQRMLSGRDSLSRVLMTVESRLHPGFGHSMLKNPDALVPEVRVAAETLFSNCFSRFDDAVLALVGDRSEYMVQKDIQVYADQFPTGGRRPQVERIPFRTLSGTASISGPGPDGLAVVAMSMPYSYNGDNLLLAETVTEAFRREICRRIAAAGCAAEVAMDFSPAPVEAVNVRVAINRIPSAGLPGVSGAVGVSDALAIVRVSLAAVASSLTAEEFGVCRKIVRARRDAAQSDPASIFEFIRVRSVSLKDINSSYQLKLDGLDLDAAKTFAGALSRSGRVEYVCE